MKAPSGSLWAIGNESRPEGAPPASPRGAAAAPRLASSINRLGKRGRGGNGGTRALDQSKKEEERGVGNAAQGERTIGESTANANKNTEQIVK